jgi:hypothetical protein
MKHFALPAVMTFALAISSMACDPATPAASTAPATPAAPAAPAGALSQEGGECGDDVAVQKKCAPGLVCAPPTKGPVSEHTPGTCKKP